MLGCPLRSPGLTQEPAGAEPRTKAGGWDARRRGEPTAQRPLTSNARPEDGKDRGDAEAGVRGLPDLPAPEGAEHET